MAHVQFLTGDATTNGLAAQLIIDGVDLTTAVLSTGFSIDPGDPVMGRKPAVRFTVACDVLNVDLPDAVLEVVAMRTEGGI